MILFLLATLQSYIYSGPMRRWLAVYGLPLEVWVDIFSFPWTSRREFGQMVDRIGNFKFSEHAQFFLHEWGKRGLAMWEHMYFEKEGLCKYVNRVQSIYDIPQTELPANIKSIHNIDIRHFDANTLDFLRLIQPLLTGFELCSFPEPDCLDNLRTTLTRLAPFLGEIRSLYCSGHALPVARQCLPDKFAQLKVLDITLCAETETQRQANVNTIMEWLTQGGNGPRLCKANAAFSDHHRLLTPLLWAIREQFLAAATPCTFAVIFAGLRDVAGHHLENRIGEELNGKLVKYGHLQITRHPANCGTELQQWIDEEANTNWGICGQIDVYNPTIGSLDAAAHGDLPAGGVEEVQQ